MNIIKKLEHYGLISKKPHPIVPFLLSLAFYLLSFFQTPYTQSLKILAFITCIFALLHTLSVILLNRYT